VPTGGVHDDRRARLGVGESIVVFEVFEARGHRGDGELVRVEVVGLARDLQAAQIVVRGGWQVRRGARCGDHSHVETGVVGDKVIVACEGDEVG